MNNKIVSILFLGLMLSSSCDNSYSQSTSQNNDDDQNTDTSALEYDGICERKTTSYECNNATKAIPFELRDDDGFGCQWLKLTRTQKNENGECVQDDNDTTGVCFSAYLDRCYENFYEIPGCNEFYDYPSYLIKDEKTYLSPTSGAKPVQGCSFDLTGTRMIIDPPECECFCLGEKMEKMEADPDFECDYDAQTCTDTSTKLMWEQTYSISPRVITFKSLTVAKNVCKKHSTGGFDDWRLPTIDEIRTVIRGCPDTESGGLCALTDSCDDEDCEVNCEGCEHRDLFYHPYQDNDNYLPIELDWHLLKSVWLDSPPHISERYPECSWNWALRVETASFNKEGCEEFNSGWVSSSEAGVICVRNL